MKLHIKETGQIKKLSMRVWNGTQWSVDFFNDAECNIIDESTVTQEEYKRIIEYWEDEVQQHNNGKYTEQFGDYDGKEIGFWFD